jgi:eukaryotic-like serine/threonine-protein kinase
MVSTRWEEMKVVFEAALLRDEQEWPSFLADSCGEDSDLAHEIHGLLIADLETSKFLETPLLSDRNFTLLTGLDDLLAPHKILCDRFEILASLGTGGMGQVYEALDRELQESIAIKAIRSEIAETPGVLTRFKREVYATRKITHPNVCRTFDLECHSPSNDDSARKITFLTMELLRGETLAQQIRRTGPLPINEVRVLAIQLANALLAAHEVGIIHCDLKPSNIFMTHAEAGLRAVVTDFGIAKFTQQPDLIPSSSSSGSMTHWGAVAGTPLYMAPEQADGGICTPGSDLYAYGLILYEAITGERPSHDNYSPQEIETKLNAATASSGSQPLNLNAEWSVLLSGCLQTDPQERFTHVQQVLDKLADISGAYPTAGSATIVQASRDPRRLGWTAWLRSIQGVVSVVLVLLLILSLAVSRFRANAYHNANQIPSVVVLPFVNHNQDPALKDLCDGITVNLTNDLAQVTGLRVPSHSAIGGSDAPHDVRSVGRTLDVDTALSGSISKEGDEFLVQVELSNTLTGAQLWGQTFTRKQADLPELEQDIAQEIAFRLRTNAGHQSNVIASRQHTTVPAAQAAYARGRDAIAEHTSASFDKAIVHFQRAIDADPQFAPAYAELANTYTLMANNYNRPEAPLALMSSAEATARRALQLDSTSAEAYSSIAQIQLLRDYNWDGAEENYKRAVQLDPGYMPAHTSYALLLLTARGRFAEAMAQFAYADQVTPKAVSVDFSEGLEAYFARRYDISSRLAEQLQKRFPGNEVAIEILAESYVAMSQPSKAITLLESITTESGDAQISRDAILGIAFARKGQRLKALRIAKRIEASEHFGVELNYHLAALWAALGDRDKAVEYLEMSYKRRQMSILFLGVDPLMDSLRSDPRFQNILLQMNLQ